MIDPTAKLTILHDDNGTFVDLTEDAADLTRDNFNLTLVAAEDYLYMGYSKPFNTAYHALLTANTAAGVFTAEIWDGTAWTAIDITDETRGWTRAGFMFWDKTSMEPTTVNGVEAHYMRLRPSVDYTVTELRGINLIFADDAMLKQEFFEVDNSNLLPPNETSHLVTHVAARNTIVQQLRNLNYKKRKDGESRARDINQWDLMDVFEIRQAATMLALSKIFFLLSDSQEDTWWAKYVQYQRRYEDMMNVITLTVDYDDDGEDDLNETNSIKHVTRWTR